MWHTASACSLLFGTEAPTTLYSERGEDSSVEVEVRSVCDFYRTTFGGCQTVSRPSVRTALVTYYKQQFRHITLSPYVKKETSKIDQGEGDSLDKTYVVKKEDEKEEEEEGMRHSSLVQHGSTVGGIEENKNLGVTVDNRLRMMGILTKVHGSVGDEALLPWELHVIHYPDEENEYSSALAALSSSSISRNGRDSLGSTRKGEVPVLLDLVGSGGGNGFCFGVGGNVVSPMFPSVQGDDADGVEEEHEPDGRCLALYPKLIPAFTGVYTGMAIGVVGEPCGRSKTGVLTALLVHELVFPSPPLLPWRIASTSSPCPNFLPASVESLTNPSSFVDQNMNPLTSPMTTSSSTLLKPNSSFLSNAARVHFCCGPFPADRHQVMALLLQVLHQALKRGANLLIIGGPFVSEAAVGAHDASTLSSSTFSEYIEGYAIFLEEEITRYYSTHRNVPSSRELRVVFLPHRLDVTQIPVLPTVKFSIPDDKHVWMRSNPCRISVDGVHIGVCNEDVIGMMQTRMVEKWPVAQHHLRRVVETLVRSRTYAPIFQFPAPEVDLKHWKKLQLDWNPLGNEGGDLSSIMTSSANDRNSSWNLVENELNKISPTEKAEMAPEMKEESEEEDEESHPPPLGKFKTEGVEDKKKQKQFSVQSSVNKSVLSSRSSDAVTAIRDKIEFMPHILLLPSSRPAFAIVTHRGVLDPARPEVVVPESEVEDITKSTGILVVNQEVWSTRSARKYELRTAEISIHDTFSVVKNGVTPENTSCELLHVFDLPNP